MTTRGAESSSFAAELHKVQSDYDRIGLDDAIAGTVGETSRDLDEYFVQGEQQVMEILASARRLGLDLKNGRALDFGCGIGRVTRALGKHFAEVHGLDIAPSMIALAKAHNTDATRCQFHLHCDHQLGLFADDCFDLIVAINVFRYIPPVLTREYLREFMRVIKPDGLVYFETSEAAGLRKIFPRSLLHVYRKFRQSHNSGPRRQDRFHFPEANVRRLISESGGKVLSVDVAQSPTLWRHCRFFATKRRPENSALFTCS